MVRNIYRIATSVDFKNKAQRAAAFRRAPLLERLFLNNLIKINDDGRAIFPTRKVGI